MKYKNKTMERTLEEHATAVEETIKNIFASLEHVRGESGYVSKRNTRTLDKKITLECENHNVKESLIRTIIFE